MFMQAQPVMGLLRKSPRKRDDEEKKFDFRSQMLKNEKLKIEVQEEAKPLPFVHRLLTWPVSHARGLVVAGGLEALAVERFRVFANLKARPTWAPPQLEILLSE